jgi:hypothetical protein
MPSLTQQRCFNHALRESVARCPECHRFYCRECVTEHEDRVVCAACLKRLARVPFLQRRGLVRGVQVLQCLAGGLLLWFAFYLVGTGLAALPDSFHQGTLWKKEWFAP